MEKPASGAKASKPVVREGGDHSPGQRRLAVWSYVDGTFGGETYALDGPDAVVNDRYLEPRRDHVEGWGERGDGQSGTIVLDTMLFKFVVRGPRSLVEDAAFRSKIADFFDLPPVVLFEAVEERPGEDAVAGSEREVRL